MVKLTVDDGEHKTNGQSQIRDIQARSDQKSQLSLDNVVCRAEKEV